MVLIPKQQKLIARLFVKTLFFVLLAYFVPTLCTVVDGMLIGKFLGVSQIAAFGFLFPYLKFTAIPALISSLGMQICCAKSLGEGNLYKAKEIFTLAIILTLISSVLELLGTLFFMDQIFNFLGAAAETAGIKSFVSNYLRAYAFGLPAILSVTVLISAMQLNNQKQRIVRAILILSVVNIIGDFANVFYFHLDMQGMALATTFANYIALIYLLPSFLKSENSLSFTKKIMQVGSIKDIILGGSPALVGRLSSIIRNLFLNYMAIKLGSIEGLAAYSIIENFFRALNDFPDSSAAATRLISGIYVGEKNLCSIHKLINFALKFSWIICLIILIIIYSFTPTIVSFYLQEDPDTESIFNLTVEGIRVIALYLPCCIFGRIVYFFYQAYGKYTLGMFLVVLDNFALVVPLIILLQGLGMEGFFDGYALSYVVLIITMFIIVWYYRKKFPTKIDDLLLLPPEFYKNQDKQLHETVTTMDEVITLSERVIEFSKANGISEKNSMFAGLTIEEMVGNVIKHGFNDGKSHYVDVSVTIDNDEVKIHICDDCRAFDPTKQLATDDSTDNLGIDLIAKIAKKFKYKNSTEQIPTGSAQYTYLLEQNNLDTTTIK